MFRVRNHHIPKSISVLLLAEITVLVFSVYAGVVIKLYGRWSFDNAHEIFTGSALIFTSAMIFSMSALGMYQKPQNTRLRNILVRLAPAYVLGLGIISVVFYLAPELRNDRGFVGLAFLFSGIGLVITRIVFLKFSQSKMFESRVLFVGSDELAKECGELAQSRATTSKYDVAGYIHIGHDKVSVPAELVVKKQKSLYQTALAHGATDIVVAQQNKRGISFPIQELLECKLNGIRVTDATAFFEREACQIRVNTLQPSWLVFGGGFDQSFIRIFCKRVFDLTASIALAIITLPIMTITALLIYLEDRGGVLYSQERVGLDGHTYPVFKFRSMRINAEQIGKPQWATTNDPRVTRVGAIIRKLRIDELPQIFNVVMGDMSFVGPRPERPYFVEELCAQIPFYNVRHSIKPGITGMAQVRYPYGASVEDAVQKLQYDLYYVKNNSLFLDMLILIDTIQVVLLGKGAR